MHYKPKYSVFTLDWGISFNNLIYCSNLNEPNRSFLSVYNTLVSEKMFFIKISWRERERERERELWCFTPFSTISIYFSYIVAVSFIGGGHQTTRRIPPTCCQSLTFFIIVVSSTHLLS
jgi:hypothetical protein